MLDLASMFGGGDEGRGGTDPKVLELLSKLVSMQDRGPIEVAPVVRHEGGIFLPEGMTYQQAIRALQRKSEEEERVTTMIATINAHPFDGAIAFHKALDTRFGFVHHKPASFFSSGSASKTVEIDAYGTTIDVPLGEYEVPKIDGTFYAGFTRENGRLVFEVRAEIQGKHRALFNEVVAMAKEIVKARSIYRGKTMQVTFVDEDGDPLDLPIIKFIDVQGAPRPIFSRASEEAFEHDVLAYVQYPDLIRELEGSLKRGILLSGSYGLGKTMAATYIASVANNNGFTVIYTSASQALNALQLARQYQPAVVFAEDIDTEVHERNEQVNELLNEMSGIGLPPNVVAIFTTNHPERIPRVFLRPGRTDVVFTITAPDAEASVRIARVYAGDFMDPEMDYFEAGDAMAGEIPASIQEIVRRAKVRARVGGYNILQPSHLVAAAQAMKREREALKPEEPEDPVDKLGKAIGTGLGEGVGKFLADPNRLVATAQASQNGHHPEPAAKASRTL